MYLLSRKITEPIISLADLISTIEDTRTFQTQRFSVYHDAELQVLCHSFTALIQRENLLMDQIIEENRQKRTAMLHALQAQINPHFLYNALDMVSWHALSKGEDSIADIVSSISNLMHYSISRPDSTASLSREIENIREFIRIYQMERPCDIQLIPDFSPEQADQIPIPKFTLQPLVENSILHNANLDHLTIRIQIHRQPDCTEISVTDDGIGADPEQLNAFLRYENTSLTVSSGFGIRNVNERLQLHFGNNSHLSYQKDSDGHLTASCF
ncbi:MAG: sensor histidine kinase [Gallintestinimicrobium sp.]